MKSCGGAHGGFLIVLKKTHPPAHLFALVHWQQFKWLPANQRLHFSNRLPQPKPRQLRLHFCPAVPCALRSCAFSLGSSLCTTHPQGDPSFFPPVWNNKGLLVWSFLPPPKHSEQSSVPPLCDVHVGGRGPAPFPGGRHGWLSQSLGWAGKWQPS